ncbi:MAG: beta-ketoacyl synthase chain length factor [Chitinophagaceae bacterium]|nr:beta-ketoacyl synthase chain length factor [Chitinophagaceae bacterium]
MYINGIGLVCAQHLDRTDGEYQFPTTATTRYEALEPDYKALIPPMQLRRMSKVVRMGIAAAKTALEQAGIEKPDVITMGTAYGCLADTEVFLQKILTQEETMLTPTAFIQSTHNTVSGQIALILGCHGHNFTFVHRGHSFETSLQESMMWLKEVPESKVLAGGIDELTDHAFQIISRFGTYKHSHDTFDIPSEGSIGGEGAGLFVLSAERNESTNAELMDIRLCHTEAIQDELNLFLSSNGLQASDIRLCLLGVNGDSRYDETIKSHVAILENCFMIPFKKWCGEFPTSGIFAFALASKILKENRWPEELVEEKSENIPEMPQHILIYNHYKNAYHSFILLRRA